MVAFIRALTIIFALLCGIHMSYEETTQRTFNLTEKSCLGKLSCQRLNTGVSSRHCLSDSDCNSNEYCHNFHQICLKSHEFVKVSQKTSVKSCKTNSNCHKTEYCHNFWKICLPSQKAYKKPRKKRPSWFCDTSNDCKTDEQCHKRFHACYKRPSVSTVRRDTGNSRRCQSTSDCGTKFYCHDHFFICLEDVPTVNSILPKRTNKKCNMSIQCPNNMLCHNLWKICFSPAKIVNLPKRNKSRGCLIDSDCLKDEYCQDKKISQTVVARQKRAIRKICLPRMHKKKLKYTVPDVTCTTEKDCGPNKTCLRSVKVCMSYKLPGEMCLVNKSDFASDCVSGSYCKRRRKWASRRRIINKMRLPEKAANYLMKTNKKKFEVGRCILST